MTRFSFLLLLMGASVACAQGVDSVLLSQTPILQTNIDSQGNLLVARRVNATPLAPVAVYRYGQGVQAFTGPGQTLSTGGYPVVLTSDPQGAIYLGIGPKLVRPTDLAPGAWAPQLPSTDQIDAIGFDPQNNPVLAITTYLPPNFYGRVLKLDRTTGQVAAQFDLGIGLSPTSMAVDSSGAVYVTGLFYLTGFAAKIDSTLQRQLYFINLDPAQPHGIAVDAAGYSYVAETQLGIPVTTGPPGGGTILFGTNTVHKLDPQGGIVTSNTGGGLAIALDGSGNPIVTGGNYPATGVFQTACGPRTDLGGLSVTVLDPVTLLPKSSAFLAQQSFLGASALLNDGSLYVATQGNRVLHVSPAAPSSPVACLANGASFQVGDSIVPGQLLTIFGRGLGTDPLTVYDESQQLPLSSNGTEVHIGGLAAPLLAVEPGQINAVVPYEVSQLDSSQPVEVEISRDGRIIYSWHMSIAMRNPTPLLYFDSNGALDILQAGRYLDALSTSPLPLADVMNEDGTRNNSTNPAHLGSTVTIFATGFGQPDGIDIPVVSLYGNLQVLSIGPIAGWTNAVLQVKAVLPALSGSGFVLPQLPFVIGQPVPGTPGWTNFLYVER